MKLNEDFQEKLLDAGVTSGEWPFTVQYGGYRSLATYVNALRDANLSRGTQEKSGDVAALRLHVGTGKRKHIVATAPYDLVQIDAHQCNFFGTVGIPHPRGIRWVAIERMWIIIVVDCFSDAILGYSIAFSTEVNADDVLRAIENALSRHELRKLTTPGVSYRPGSGFPSGVFDSLVGAGWACLMLDNALAHLSIAVTERARRRVGCAVNFGPVRHWFRRPQIERVFGSIENAGFMRLHSTSGRSNADPLAKDAIKRALQAKLTSDAIEDLTEVILADFGASLKEGLGFISSIDLLRNALEDNNPPFLPMPIAESTSHRPLTVSTETCRVGGNQAQGRRAHIVVDRVKYTNAVLSSSPHLIGQTLTVEIDEEDMRVIRTFFPDGTELGALPAVGQWGLLKHTRRMRKEINRLLSKRHLKLRAGEDPISGYLRHLAEMASADSESDPKKVSRAGTKVVLTSRKADTAIPEVGSLPPTPFSETSSPTLPKDSNRQTSRGINLKPQY